MSADVPASHERGGDGCPFCPPALDNGEVILENAVPPLDSLFRQELNRPR